MQARLAMALEREPGEALRPLARLGLLRDK